jgi:hypothetical protein
MITNHSRKTSLNQYNYNKHSSIASGTCFLPKLKIAVSQEEDLKNMRKRKFSEF